MAKNKKMVSLLGFEDSFVKMFSSYCQLLKPRLKDQWIIDKTNSNSDIVIINSGHEDKVDQKVKVKIVLGGSDSLEQPNNKGQNSVNIFNVEYPISSSKILDTLNKVSNIEGINNKKTFNSKISFSFKNVFSKFLHLGDKESQINKVEKQVSKASQNKTHVLANKLMEMRYPDSYKSLKVVFLGRPGSGKTTAITSASISDRVLTSEVNATDSVGLIKDKTTIGIDYGECKFDNNIKLRLYGTPGQVRYDYVQTQTVARADIYVVLIDLSSVAPYSEFMYYKNIIDTAGNDKALRVVVFTHYDLQEHNMAQLSKEIRQKCHGEVLTVKVDTRQKDEVRFMLNKAAEIKLSDVPPHQYYADNALFLKNINA